MNATYYQIPKRGTRYRKLDDASWQQDVSFCAPANETREVWLDREFKDSCPMDRETLRKMQPEVVAPYNPW